MTDALDAARPVATVSDELGERFIENLRGICAAATLQLALRVGQLVIETFYGGSLGLWRTRRKVHPSLRRLAQRRDLPISPSRLYRCVAIYELGQLLPALCTWKRLGASHVRTVLGMPLGDQRHLLESAERESWSVQRLESEVQRLRRDATSRRGRPPHSERSKRLLVIQRWLEDCPDSLPAIDPDRIDAERRAELHARALAVRNRCAELEASLRSSKTEVSAAKGRALSRK
jgi:hypothetical protein